MRVCSTGDYRPFTYRDPQDRWSGLDVDMARNLADPITVGRAQQALYSAPYLRDGKAAIARRADVSKYQTMADIDRPSVRIVVNPGGTNADFDKEHLRHARIVTYPDNNTIFEQLANDAADVMITDASEIRWQTKQDPQLCGIGVSRVPLAGGNHFHLDYYGSRCMALTICAAVCRHHRRSSWSAAPRRLCSPWRPSSRCSHIRLGHRRRRCLSGSAAR